jgi:ornithine cyclodeaminase/alanine dehydrogenase-like protein (mu-crystallin family)
MLYVTESQVQELLPMSEAIGLMKTAFERLASGEALNQPRRRLALPTGAVLHYMAASDGKYFGTKIYSTHPRHGAHFTFLLYRAEDAEPLATFEANYLGQIRTGAVSGLATQLMSRTDSQTLAIIGSGFQARSQLEAMLSVRRIQLAKVWSRSAEKRAAFAEECSRKFPIKIEVVETAGQAVRDADVVVTATNAKDPVLEKTWLEPGAHINAMGSNQATRRELPDDVIAEADWVVVDSLEQAAMESGDILLALNQQSWKEGKLVELKDVVSGRVQTRTRPDQLTVFKSNGIAVEDVIAAGYIYERLKK